MFGDRFRAVTPPPALRRPRHLLLAVIILLGAFALRVWRLDAQSIWYDEGLAIYAAAHPLDEIPAADSFNPPLYHYMLHAWTKLLGRSEFAVRTLPVLMGTLLVAAVWTLGRRWFSPGVGALAALLAATSPYLWWYAQETRMYTLIGLEVLGLVFLVDRLVVSPRPMAPSPTVGRGGTAPSGATLTPLSHKVRGVGGKGADRLAWTAALSLEAATLFTHSVGAAVVLWLNLMLVVSWVWARRWRLLAIWLATQAALVGLFAPWLLAHGRDVEDLSTVTFHAPRLGDLLTGWESLFAGSWALVGDDMLLSSAARLVLVVAAGGMVVLLARSRWRRRAGVLLVHALLMPAITVGLLLVGGYAFHSRYLSTVAAVVIVLLAAGAFAVFRSGRVGRLFAVVGVAGVLGLFAYALHQINTTPVYQRDDARSLSRYYAQTLASGDVVVVPYGDDYALMYYGVEPATLVALDLATPSVEGVRDALNTLVTDATRVEMVFWDKAFSDRHGVLTCLLARNGRRLGKQFQVVGLGTQGYAVDTPLAAPPPQPATGDFGVMQLEGAAFAVDAPADRARCVILDWRLTAPVSYDLGVALTVINPLGWEIVHADAPLLRADFAPTSFWEVGQGAQSFAVLHLSAGVPPGEYPVRARIYDADTLVALDLRVNGAPAGKDVTLGVLQVWSPEGEQVADLDDGLTPLGAALGDGGLALDAYRTPAGPVQGGQTLRVALRWRAGEGPAAPILRLDGEAWQVEAAGEVSASAPHALVLDWREITVPADAPTGRATLSVTWENDAITLAELEVQATDRRLVAPPFDAPLGAEFVGVGVLEGFSLETDSVSTRETLPLTLVWRAADTPDVAYTVFTHLLDAEGRLIAQHDAPPAGGIRPTTGWLPPEYVVDSHALTFIEAGMDYAGPATLEVGLYDPTTGARAPLASGDDHVILPVAITVRE